MATVTCIAPGLTVAGIETARTFVPGDVIDPDAVVATHAGGRAVTWRDVLGAHLASHFAVQTSAQVPDSSKPKRSRASAEPLTDAAE